MDGALRVVLEVWLSLIQVLCFGMARCMVYGVFWGGNGVCTTVHTRRDEMRQDECRCSSRSKGILEGGGVTVVQEENIIGWVFGFRTLARARVHACMHDG